MNPIIVYVAAFVFGTIVGSFLNVCIIRLPQSKSVISPPSHCPQCQSPIRFYDNIPILSYLILRGRCRQCQATISAQYPLIELIGGTFSLAFMLRYGVSLQYFIYFAFFSALVVIAFIDLRHQIIPDIISLSGIPAGFLSSLILPQISILDSALGILTGGGSLLLVAILYHLIARREGMGGGDIKLLAMIGAFLGWQGAIFSLIIGSLFGSLTGIALMIVEKKDRKFAIPFGPFLSLGAIVYLFWGEGIIRGYFMVLGR